MTERTRDALLLAIAEGMVALMEDRVAANPRNFNARTMKMVELQGYIQTTCVLFKSEMNH